MDGAPGPKPFLNDLCLSLFDRGRCHCGPVRCFLSLSLSGCSRVLIFDSSQCREVSFNVPVVYPVINKSHLWMSCVACLSSSVLAVNLQKKGKAKKLEDCL